MIAMKIGMKEDMGVADKMTLSNFELCAERLILRKVRQNTLICSLSWLEGYRAARIITL